MAESKKKSDTVRKQKQPKGQKHMTPEAELRKIKSGSIIQLFDKTPAPKKPSDVYCPHFWELKYANGCKFDCQWCLDGETKIMMGDLSWKNLEDIHIGDEVMGFEKFGSTNKLVSTKVLAKRKITKERIKLTTDKTEIISSYDHKFLSNGRWTKAKFLGTADSGISYLIEPTTRTPDTADYKSGYLQGVSDGDGTIGIYESNGQKQFKYRLAMKDKEAIDRAQEYFNDFEIKMNRFMHKAGSGTLLHAIRKDGRNNCEKIDQVIHLAIINLKQHFAGYLAGIFDAEGSYSNFNLRIANTDDKILSRIKEAVTGLGFEYKEENHKDHIPVIRITGGIKKHLKLFNIINPAIKRKYNNLTTRFDKTTPVFKAERLPAGILYDIQTGTENFIANGLVSHNCYLLGTFGRWSTDGRDPRTPRLKNEKQIMKDLEEALERLNTPQLFNAGEVSDSMLYPHMLLNEIIPLFQKYEDKGHKLLLLTKDVKNAIMVMSRAHAPRSVIFAWSVNAHWVSRSYEILAPDSIERLSAAARAINAGYEVRLRIDPMAPVNNWKLGYRNLIKDIMRICPWVTVITLGSLRGLQSTINEAKRHGKDTSWLAYLGESSSWGKKIDEDTRFEMYEFAITELQNLGYRGQIALCKETLSMWERLKEAEVINYGPGDKRCNCTLSEPNGKWKEPEEEADDN